MKFRGYMLGLAVLMAFSPMVNAATRLSILRSSGSVTHQWEYMPSGETVTQQGLKNKQYPLTLLPSATYIQSEPINIEGCDLGLTVRYNVASSSNHAVRVELVDEAGNVVYSHFNEDINITLQLSVGEEFVIGEIPGVKSARLRVSLSDAYDADEAINLIELELYSKNGAGVETVTTRGFSVKAELNALIVNSMKNTVVEIYNLNGEMVKNNAISIGENRININSGFYILNLDGDVYKVFVP